MPIYRIRILDDRDRIIAGQYSYLKDDEAARERAAALAAQAKHSNIQIWSSDRQVPRERPDKTLAAADDRSTPPSNDSQRQSGASDKRRS